MALPIPRWRTTPLWLYPELDCSSCVADADDQSGPGQVAHYIDYVRERCREWWVADAVPITWSVRGDGIWEYAPNKREENFLTFWTPPADAKTGEPLNWWRLRFATIAFPSSPKRLAGFPRRSRSSRRCARS